jgi:hypothetical protein
MLDLDTGEDPFPYSPDGEKWIYWYKSTDESSTRQWSLVSDDRLFYFNWNCNGDILDFNDWRLGAFGDIISFVPNDQWHCIINGSFSNATDAKYEGFLTTKPYQDGGFDSLYYDRGTAIARAFNGYDIGVPLMGSMHPTFGSPQFYHDVGGSRDGTPPGRHGLTYPNPVDGGAYLFKLYSIEGYRYRSLIRGEIPGVLGLLHDLPFNNDGTILFKEFVVNGEKKKFLTSQYYGGTMNRNYTLGYSGQMLMNLSDKWR